MPELVIVDQKTQIVKRNTYFNATLQNTGSIFGVDPVYEAPKKICKCGAASQSVELTLLYAQARDYTIQTLPPHYLTLPVFLSGDLNLPSATNSASVHEFIVCTNLFGVCKPSCDERTVTKTLSLFSVYTLLFLLPIFYPPLPLSVSLCLSRSL